MAYLVCNRRGDYLASRTVPALWSRDKAEALSFDLFDAASKAIDKLFNKTVARRIGARVVWEG